MQALADQDFMPFGKYGPKGEARRLEDVPAGYLLWLWESEGDGGLWNDLSTWKQPLRKYIIENWDALLMDAPDFVANHDPKRLSR